MATPQLHRAQFFGDSARALYGVFHEGSGDTVRDAGVLICPPAPQEYSMFHWGVRHLASMLAAAGFPVLRFDYSCTGDSAGDADQASIARWVEDIGTAEEALRESAGVRRTHIVGVRLGGTLALRAVAAGVTARDLILWDPVINGHEYVAAMEHFDDQIAIRRHFPVSNQRAPGELLGYPMGDAFRHEITSIDLLTEPLAAPRRQLVVAPTADPRQRQFVARVEAEGYAIVHEVVDDPIVYAPRVDPTETILANAAPRAMLAFLESRR